MKYFVETYRYGLLAGDAAPLQDISASECNTCHEMIDEIKNGDMRYIKADWTLGPVHGHAKNFEYIDTALRVSSDSVGAKNGRKVEQTFLIGAAMQWKQGRWEATGAGVQIEER